MNNTVDPKILTEAEAKVAKGELDAALTQLIQAQAWLDQESNITNLPPDEQPKAIILGAQIGNAIIKIQNAQLNTLINSSQSDLARIKSATADLEKTSTTIDKGVKYVDLATTVVGLVLKVLKYV